MSTKRTIGTLAALGGLTAAIALLSGLPSAKADELSDLRANQQLLQQRLDQLAQAIPGPGSPYPGGPPGPVGVQMVGGSFPRSFLIPGTDTSIRVGGEIREVLDYFFDGGNANQGTPWNTTVGDNGQAQAIPLTATTRAKGHSIFGQSPRESKLNVETRTPSAWGEVRSFLEFDWAGSTNFAPGGGNPTSVSDNLHPRLRYAYGTLGGLLFGQANSNFSDSDAGAETIDFGGTFGDPGVVRLPQVRYTVPLAPWGFPGAFSMSAETPETDIAFATGAIVGQDAGAGTTTTAASSTCTSTSTVTGAGTAAEKVSTTTSCTNGTASVLPATNPAKTPAPDLTFAWYIPQPWGHMDFSTVVRPTLQLKDGAFVDRTFTGWGIHFGGDVKPGWFGWTKDDITFNFVYGDAIGRYLNSSSNFALITNYPATGTATADQAATLRIRPTVGWGGNVGYKHYWTPTLRSTISGGILHHDINNLGGAEGFVCSVGASATSGGCALNKELINAHANLIWNPVPFADIGIEYTWAHRLVLSNAKGDMNALIGRFRVQF